MRLSSLGKRVESLERRLEGAQEREDSERFWTAMVGQEEELCNRLAELRPFEEALMRLWRAYTAGGQEVTDKIWETLNETQRALWEAYSILYEHVMRRLKDSDVPEFDVSVWPEEVRKLVLEEAEE